MRKLIPFLLLFLLTIPLKAQVAFELSVRNMNQTALNILEFDVYLLDTDAEKVLELASCQLGFLFNSQIYSGGSITAAMDNSGSGLNSLQKFSGTPGVVTTLSGYPGQTLIRIAGRTPPGAGSGTIISGNGYGTLLTHIILTGSVNFASGSRPGLTFTASTTTPPIYPTQLAAYVGTANTILTVIPGTNAIVSDNPELNPVTGIRDGITIKSFEIYPNPNPGEFMITIEPLYKDEFTLKIINEKGKTVMKEENIIVDDTYTYRVTLKDPQPGMYMVVLTNETRSFTRKMIVAR